MLERIRSIRNHKTFKAFQYRNYRLWFFGQMISLFGTWMQSTAQGYLIYELTHSATYLGLVGFFAGIPAWIFMLYGGVIADRVDRRVLLTITQTGMMILALILSVLVFTHIVQPWHILVLAFFLGVCNAFDAPARQAFVTDMVGKEHLGNAVALNSTMFNSAVIIGPALGGMVYATFGAGWCFLLNGLSFIAVIIALTLMKLEKGPAGSAGGSRREDLAEGIRYVASHPEIRVLVLHMGAFCLFGLAFLTLIPAWTVSVLHGDATTNGMLLSARGVGALSMALWIASRGQMKSKGVTITTAAFLFPLFLMLFSFLPVLAASLLLLVGLGATNIAFNNLTNVLLQTKSDERMRGRVMSFFSFIIFGIMPLGALWIGFAAQRLGIQGAMLLSAGLTLTSTFLIWRFVPSLRALD
jgi:MFS family permease